MNWTDAAKERAVEILHGWYLKQVCSSCTFANEPNKNKACQNCAPTHTPDYFGSLNVWRSVWQAIDKLDDHRNCLWEIYFDIYQGLSGGSLAHVNDGTTGIEEFGSGLLLGEPHHHMEAALNTIEIECDKCEDGKQLAPYFGDGFVHERITCHTCHGKGKITGMEAR